MKVYLDMDGVLADFRRGVCEAFGFPYDNPSRKWIFWDDWPDVTSEMVDAVCTQEFWQSLNWTHDGVDIFIAVFEKFRVEQIYLLTAPMSNYQSAGGKILWLRKHGLQLEKHLIITQASKSLFAGSNTLLIDDKDENVEEFRTAGGQAILVPRPWNKNHDCQRSTLDYVAHKLEGIVL